MASPPSAEATLHPRFGAIGEARQATIAARSTFFQRTHPRWLLRASVDRWDGLHQVLPTRGDRPRRKPSSENRRRPAAVPGDHPVLRAGARTVVRATGGGASLE